MATIIVSAIISAITSKIVATYYFEKVDGYVKEMCEMTKKKQSTHISYFTQTARKSKAKGDELKWRKLKIF